MAARGEKKVYDRETSEERIKQAALVLFAENGFKGTTTRMIAERAESNIALISRYFGSKQALLKTLMTEVTGKLVNQALSYPAQEGLAEELRLYILSNLAEIRTNLSFFRMLIHEALCTPEYQGLLDTLVPKIDSRLVPRLEQLRQQGRIMPDYDIKQLSIATNMFISGMVFRNQIFLNKELAELESDVAAFITVVCEQAAC